MNSLNGIFAVYKPQGLSSASFLDKVKAQLICAQNTHVSDDKSTRKAKKLLKMGHGGTLDPMAEGVLVVGIGKGCKRLSSLLAGTKEYTFDLLLGTHYDTFDTTGKPLATADYGHVTEEAFQCLIPQFTGDIMQKPPTYSALWIDGRRAYDMARKGEEMPEMQARSIHIVSITMNSFSLPTITCTAEVGGGCYIRSLCVDMANALETKGAMSRLVRNKHGPFTLSSCLTLEECSDLERIKSVLQ